MNNNTEHLIEFPDDFLWGASASHFQVEGQPNEIEERLSDWSRWTQTPGNISDGSSADRACEFYRRYQEDIELLQDLNLRAYRTSLNWAALMPDEPSGSGEHAVFSPPVVDYYRALFSHLKERDIKVFVTLFHFCLPDWLARKGGWIAEDADRHFETFARLAALHFGDLVDFWMTVNEPMAYVYQGYVAGNWPPGESHNYVDAFKAVKGMLKGHGLAYHALKAESAGAQVSFANHWRPFAPERKWHPLDQLVTHYRERVFNHCFPESIEAGALKMPGPLSRQKAFKELEGDIPYLEGTMDFVGVNYYTRELSRFDLSWPPDYFGSRSPKTEYPVNALGWEIYPEGFYQVLTQDIRPYSLDGSGLARPVYITENGYAQRFSPEHSSGDWSIEDRARREYLISHLVVLKRAIEAGVNIKGYLHWSLTDNFEWSDGLTPRFGLVRVSYDSQERQKRLSADLYASVAESNRLDANRETFKTP